MRIDQYFARVAPPFGAAVSLSVSLAAVRLSLNAVCYHHKISLDCSVISRAPLSRLPRVHDGANGAAAAAETSTLSFVVPVV